MVIVTVRSVIVIFAISDVFEFCFQTCYAHVIISMFLCRGILRLALLLTTYHLLLYRPMSVTSLHCAFGIQALVSTTLIVEAPPARRN